MSNHRFQALTAVTQYLGYVIFTLYCAVFMITVLTLRRGMIRFQLSQLMWTMVIIGMVVFQCKYFAYNTLNGGLFWFFFPMATVVMNDVSAYFCGITMGRRFIKAPFLSLSPNKTWEGYIGAAVLTVVFSFFFPALLARWTWFTCPTNDLYVMRIPPPPLHCTPHKVFQPAEYTLPFAVLGTTQVVTLLPIQVHGLAYGLFASLVAPFGGFFASAIKRAYKRKDFDAFLPGHGGMMDRMDCMLLMIFFASFHYRFVMEHHATPSSVDQILSSIALMPMEAQAEVLRELSHRLVPVGAAAL